MVLQRGVPPGLAASLMPQAERFPAREAPRCQAVTLLSTTLGFDKAARLAMAFADMDCRVAVLCPSGHVARLTRRVWRCLPYRALRPQRSLQNAIQQVAPDLIIPCDERALHHMQLLFASTDDAAVRERLRRSLSPPETFAVTKARFDQMAVARREGVPVPHTRMVSSVADLYAWQQEQPLPWVLKSDGSWAGMGVRTVNSLPEAVTAFEEMSRPVKARRVAAAAILERDFFWLIPWLLRAPAVVSGQQHIAGTAANCALACWEGEVLAGVAVEVIMTRSVNGPASVIRVIEGADMMESARHMVRALRLTGLVGFDFMIEAATGICHMIEMNARAVPVSHIAFGGDRDLVQALMARMTKVPLEPRPPVTERDLVVLFPGVWHENPDSSMLAEGYHDVPWQEPDLLRKLLRPEPRWRTWLRRTFSRGRTTAKSSA
jgi:hypothetical protein